MNEGNLCPNCDGDVFLRMIEKLVDDKVKAIFYTPYYKTSLDLTMDEIQSILGHLDQCASEGYLHADDPANTAIDKMDSYVKIMKDLKYE